MPIYTEIKNGKKTHIAHVSKMINGKRKVKKRRGISSEAKARRVELELLLELEKLKDQPDSYIFQDWSKHCLEKMKLELKNSTIKNYESYLKKWIDPILGQCKLEEITPSMVHSLIFEKTPRLSLDGKRNLLKKLKRIFRMAVNERLLQFNPTDGIKVKVPEPKRFVLNIVEIDKLLHEAHRIGHPFYNHWVLALLTGMRSGELYALKWTDIDFEGNFISVTKAWSSKDGYGATKTGMNRTVPMSQKLKSFLLELRAKSNGSSEYVLEHLKEWTNGEAAGVLRGFCNQLGITSIKFHDLRATFITQLLLQGVPVAKVMKIVGHRELKTTMVYLRLVANDVQGATEALTIDLPDNRSKGNVINLFN